MIYLFLHLIMHYYAFVIVSLTWLAYFLSHDYLSYINSLGFLFIFCFSLTKGQRSKRYTILSVLAVHRPFYISIIITCLPRLVKHANVHYSWQFWLDDRLISTAIYLTDWLRHPITPIDTPVKERNAERMLQAFKKEFKK